MGHSKLRENFAEIKMGYGSTTDLPLSFFLKVLGSPTFSQPPNSPALEFRFDPTGDDQTAGGEGSMRSRIEFTADGMEFSMRRGRTRLTS